MKHTALVTRHRPVPAMASRESCGTLKVALNKCPITSLP